MHNFTLVNVPVRHMVEMCMLSVVQHTSVGKFGHNKAKVTTVIRQHLLSLVPKFW